MGFVWPPFQDLLAPYRVRIIRLEDSPDVPPIPLQYISLIRTLSAVAQVLPSRPFALQACTRFGSQVNRSLGSQKEALQCTTNLGAQGFVLLLS